MEDKKLFVKIIKGKGWSEKHEGGIFKVTDICPCNNRIYVLHRQQASFYWVKPSNCEFVTEPEYLRGTNSGEDLLSENRILKSKCRALEVKLDACLRLIRGTYDNTLDY